MAELATAVIAPAAGMGLAIVVTSLAALLIGVAGGIITISSVSLIGVLTGLVLMLLGPAHLRALCLPLAYLVFMMPVLDVVVEPLHQPLQLLAARVVSAVFGLAGVPTYRDGTLIQFPNGILEVAVECSGAGYLISVLAIGWPLASLVLRTWRSRVMLIVTALLISIVGNWARITVVGTIGYVSGWGPQVHGPLHVLQGMLVYWIGFCALFAGAWMLTKVEGRRALLHRDRMTRKTASVVAPDWGRWRRNGWTALGTLAIALVYVYGYDRGPVAATQSFSTFPSVIGKWTAEESTTEQPLVKIQGADQELARLYRKADGSAILLYLAYLTSQSQGHELIDFRTAQLHEHVDERTLPTGDTTMAAVNLGFWEGRHSRKPLLFWYAIHGRSYASRYEAKAATVMHALARQGSHGALVVISGTNSGSAAGIPFNELDEFAQAVAPLLIEYVQ